MLERYRYTIALAGLVLLFLPRVPGIGQQVNGAYLGVGIGPISFQPAEFGKIAIIIFLAAYLRDTRQVLVQGSRRFLGVTIPPLKHFGPLLVVWGAAMVMLVFIRDLGSSLMYFGGFLALLYVATNRLSFVAIGMVMFAVGAWFFASTVSHVQERVDIWLDPFKPEWVERQGYQIAQSLFAQADGGLFGTGLGASLLDAPDGNSLIPAPHTDLIYAVITSELGLVGACGLVLVYMLFVERGFRTAMLATDSFSKLLAAGLSAVFALQVFVIVGGVTRVIPLTGVTLPFVSYGGSSILANFVLLALLLLVSDRARRPDGAMGRRGLTTVEHPDHPPVRAVPGAVRGARVRQLALDGVRRRRPARQPQQPPHPVRGAADQARHHPRRRRPGAGGQPRAAGRPLRAPLSDRRAVLAPGRLHVARPRADRPRGVLQRPA